MALESTEAARTDGKGLGIRDQLRRIAGYLSKLPRGDRAALRRLREGKDHFPPAVFWRIVDRYEIRPSTEPFWLNVIPLMVEHSHRPGRRAGRVLQQADVAAARVERWLRLTHHTAWAEARRLLSKADGGFDWADFGVLLFFWTEENRLAFARDFFLGPPRQAAPDTQTDEGDE